MILPYIYDVDISQPLLPTILQPMMVTGDKLANRIGVRLHNGQQDYTPDGSCRGYVLRSDGATVPILNGVVSGNLMYIDLPEAAYAVQGAVVISIVCVTSTAVTTVFLGSGSVNRSQSSVVIDPGTVIDDISTLIQEIETAVASIPQDYSTLSANMNALTHVGLSITGNYIAPGGAQTANAEYNCSDFIPVDADSVLILKGFFTGTSSGSALAYAFYGASKAFISGQNGISTDTIVTTIPSGAAYVRFSSRVSQGETPAAYVSNHVVEDVADLMPRMATVEAEIKTEKSESKSLTSGKFYANGDVTVGSTMYSGSSSSNGKYTATPIDISFCSGGGKVELSLETVTASSTVVSAITDDSNKVLAKYITSGVLVLDGGVYKGTITVDNKNAKYLYVSVYKGSETLAVNMTKIDASNKSHARFVATNGSDDNDGMSMATPMATITNAIKSGGRTICIAGGKYFQNIDLANAVDNIRIVPSVKDGLPILYAPNSLIAEEETAVSGYTKVYSCPCTKTFSNKVYWIYQDGVPDVTTEITAEDRHPLQRGKPYRCDDTAIKICTASTLSDALTEIENASDYKFFMDTANDTLYFSRPQPVSSTNPIMYGDDTFALFSGASRRIELEMVGIGVKYQRVNLAAMVSPVLTDCFCGNVTGQGAFRYDGTSGAKFYRCEAFRVAYSSSSGDGFNAHSNNTGDAFAKQTGCLMFDCWAHDCCDDGYSDHERCETTIYGGLFENNGAGVTPAQGSHCTCYNVLSRYNGEADFFYTGNPISMEGGVGGQIACYGCVAKGKGASSSRGYRLNGSAVRGLFVGCVAINEGTGFYGESSATGTLINCSTVNCSTAKTSHYTAINGTPVT